MFYGSLAGLHRDNRKLLRVQRKLSRSNRFKLQLHITDPPVVLLELMHMALINFCGVAMTAVNCRISQGL